MPRVSFKTLTLSDAEWAVVTAPQPCSYFFVHALGLSKAAYVASSDPDDPTAQDEIDADWTMDIPTWSQAGVRWQQDDVLLWLKASAGNGGMRVGVTFLL